MFPDNLACFIGVIEWPEREPDVIVAATAHEVRLQALTYILTTDLDGTPHFAFDVEDDVSLFVTDNPCRAISPTSRHSRNGTRR